MSSIVPGFEYDIFISYRHNDNRSGWVTEFVKQLNEELAATIKEPVSVYFDSNPLRSFSNFFFESGEIGNSKRKNAQRDLRGI